MKYKLKPELFGEIQEALVINKFQVEVNSKNTWSKLGLDIISLVYPLEIADFASSFAENHNSDLKLNLVTIMNKGTEKLKDLLTADIGFWLPKSRFITRYEDKSWPATIGEMILMSCEPYSYIAMDREFLMSRKWNPSYASKVLNQIPKAKIKLPNGIVPGAFLASNEYVFTSEQHIKRKKSGKFLSQIEQRVIQISDILLKFEIKFGEIIRKDPNFSPKLLYNTVTPSPIDLTLTSFDIDEQLYIGIPDVSTSELDKRETNWFITEFDDMKKSLASRIPKAEFFDLPASYRIKSKVERNLEKTRYGKKLENETIPLFMGGCVYSERNGKVDAWGHSDQILMRFDFVEGIPKTAEGEIDTLTKQSFNEIGVNYHPIRLTSSGGFLSIKAISLRNQINIIRTSKMNPVVDQAE